MKARTALPAIRSGAMALLALLALSTAFAADITFFAMSDTHYGDKNKTGSQAAEMINALPGTAYPPALGGVVGKPRGVIMAGDLINDGAVEAKYPDQWAEYRADYGVNGEGRCKFPVFESVGNHDVNPNMFVYNQVKERNVARKKLKLIDHVSENGYHYSWDWDGIHFVNVNLFPGNVWAGEADAYGAGHDPMHARDFLAEDLRKNVGDSGRPVVVVQHFRPVDENWWTYAAADKYHKVIQDYNVILIMVGHQGGGVENVWRGINWASSNGTLEAFRITPDNKLAAVPRTSKGWETPFVKDIFLSYASSALPAAVNNGDWATDITPAQATLSGKILYAAVPDTRVTVYWGAADGGDKPGAWEQSKDLGVQKPGAAFSARIEGLKPWTEYYYRCRATNAKGDAWAAASVPFSTPGVLPEGWQTAFIGNEQRPGGGADQADGTFTVRGSGRDIGEGNQPDNFQYAWTELDGDGEILARVATLAANTRDPKAGVMLRESLDPKSKSAAVLLNKGGSVRLFARSQDGGATAVGPNSAGKSASAWVKLVRQGDSFTAFQSQDGKEWTAVGAPAKIGMAAKIRAGLSVTAGNRDGSRNQVATFDQVKITKNR